MISGAPIIGFTAGYGVREWVSRRRGATSINTPWKFVHASGLDGDGWRLRVRNARSPAARANERYQRRAAA